MSPLSMIFLYWLPGELFLDCNASRCTRRAQGRRLTGEWSDSQTFGGIRPALWALLPERGLPPHPGKPGLRAPAHRDRQPKPRALSGRGSRLDQICGRLKPPLSRSVRWPIFRYVEIYGSGFPGKISQLWWSGWRPTVTRLLWSEWVQAVGRAWATGSSLSTPVHSLCPRPGGLSTA